jgi:hypothetical protein
MDEFLNAVLTYTEGTIGALLMLLSMLIGIFLLIVPFGRRPLASKRKISTDSSAQTVESASQPPNVDCTAAPVNNRRSLMLPLSFIGLSVGLFILRSFLGTFFNDADLR